MKHERKILVTGAGGQIGGIGNQVVRLLLAKGRSVRAMVHKEDARSEELRNLGAEIVAGDLLDLGDLNRAVEGCQVIYFGMSVSEKYLTAAASIGAVAKHYDVEAFVNMSQLTVSEMSINETTNSAQQRFHWLAEQLLGWSGLPVVQVRPTIFMDTFFLTLSAETVKAHDEIRLPIGSGKTSPIASQDVAKALSAILINPEEFLGSVVELTGPESQNATYYANEFSEALGRRIRYINVPMDEWEQALVQAGVNPHLLNHLMTMADLHRLGRYDRMTNQFERLTGEKPMTMRAFVKYHEKRFARNT